MAELGRIVVAMSGGVDSSVAAALLVEQGYEVVGLFMRHGVAPGENAKRGKQGCCSLDDSMDARVVAEKLGVAFYCLNFSKDFGRIIDYFVDEYNAGRTPNPCIQCNRWLKFGRLLEYADEIGASHVATGHYARIHEQQVDGETRYSVGRAADPSKDQSYVLFPLNQSQLARTLLPLGHMQKTEVRAEAERLGLPVFNKPDSQEICFVPDNDYRRFLKDHAAEDLAPGKLLNTAGEVVGDHDGHQLFTIGQRKGFGKSFGKPTYVIDINAERNEVVVGDNDQLGAMGLILTDPIWQAQAPLKPGETARGEIKIRYRHDAIPALLTMKSDDRMEVAFTESIRAVTPGQAAVLYRDDQVQVGGFIESVLIPSGQDS